MTFKERIDNEKDNLTKIVLYNDRGLFFNLVERSAYAFCTRIKPFKVHVKTVKGLDAPFVSIGVPVEKKEEYLKDLAVTKDDSGNVIALLTEPVDENAFQAWKKHIIEQKKIEAAAKATQSTIPDGSVHADAPEIPQNGNQNNDVAAIRECLQDIRQLNLASMTPMEAMLYLNTLQNKVKNINI